MYIYITRRYVLMHIYIYIYMNTLGLRAQAESYSALRVVVCCNGSKQFVYFGFHVAPEYGRLQIHLYIYMFVCIYLYVCISIVKYIYIYIYIYLYMYI
jgi:hypothetical protein